MAHKKADEQKWPGLPERLRQAFQQSEYWNWKRDRPEIIRFSVKHGILAGYVYRYVKGQSVPDRENLCLLAKGLGVSPAWLLFGDGEEDAPSASKKAKRPRQPVPISGGSGITATLPVDARDPLVTDPIPALPPLAKYAPIRDIMSICRRFSVYLLGVSSVSPYLQMA